MQRADALNMVRRSLPTIESTPSDRVEFNMLLTRTVDDLEKSSSNFDRAAFLSEVSQPAPDPSGKRPCHCYASTNIAEEINYGTGRLDFYGFWQFPCRHPKSLAWDRAQEREQAAAISTPITAHSPGAGS